MENSSTIKPKSIADLKANARGSMLGHIGPMVSSTAIFSGVSLILAMITTISTEGSNLLTLVMYYVLGIATATVIETLRYGLCTLYLKINCQKSFKLSDLFSAFQEKGGRILPATIIMAALSFLSLLPANLYDFFVLQNKTPDTNSIYISIALIAIGILVYYVLYFIFSMTYYILIDLPSIGSWHALKMSAWLINGHKLRYLGLLLSFIPLHILGFLSCGIGSLFVFPYQFSSSANFYLNLCTIKSSK